MFQLKLLYFRPFFLTVIIFKKISTRLKKDKIQRILYGTALIVWLAVWIGNINIFNSDSPHGIKNYWIIIIPTVILRTDFFQCNSFMVVSNRNHFNLHHLDGMEYCVLANTC